MVDSIRSRRSSKDVLHSMLSNLQHLNLSDQIQYDGPVLQAHGGFCDVFQGRWMSRGVCMYRVAIKRLRVHIQSDRDFAKQLAKEICVWSKLYHRNVLPLLGYVIEGDYPSLVAEWMENGTVSRYMQTHPHADLLRMVLGIAEGLEYLHNEGVIHSDVKADNVLVSRSGAPRICDFGISRMIAASQSFGETSTQTGIRGSVRWMAPELLAISSGPQAEHTMESDIWAFGMTVYELLTEQVPYSYLKRDVQVMFTILQGVPPECPRTFFSWPVYYQKLWGICVVSWRWHPPSRRPLADVVSYLQFLCRRSDEERYNSEWHDDTFGTSETPNMLGQRQPSILGQDDSTVAYEKMDNAQVRTDQQTGGDHEVSEPENPGHGALQAESEIAAEQLNTRPTSTHTRERTLSLDTVGNQNVTPDFDLRRPTRLSPRTKAHLPSAPLPPSAQPGPSHAKEPSDLIKKWQEGLKLPPSVRTPTTSRDGCGGESDAAKDASLYLSPYDTRIMVRGDSRSTVSSNASSTIGGRTTTETSTVSDSVSNLDPQPSHLEPVHATISPNVSDVVTKCSDKPVQRTLRRRAGTVSRTKLFVVGIRDFRK